MMAAHIASSFRGWVGFEPPRTMRLGCIGGGAIPPEPDRDQWPYPGGVYRSTLEGGQGGSSPGGGDPE